MEAKLTLKLDNAVIQSAKKYAKKHNRSLSRLVENYFRNLSPEFQEPAARSSFVESLSGVLSQNDLDKFAGEDERVRHILRREP